MPPPEGAAQLIAILPQVALLAVGKVPGLPPGPVGGPGGVEPPVIVIAPTPPIVCGPLAQSLLLVPLLVPVV